MIQNFLGVTVSGPKIKYLASAGYTSIEYKCTLLGFLRLNSPSFRPTNEPAKRGRNEILQLYEALECAQTGIGLERWIVPQRDEKEEVLLSGHLR
jgi:hypothetical protein